MSKKKSFWTIRSVIDLVGILGFIMALAIVIGPAIIPARAKLTIYVDHFEESGSSESNATAITIYLKIVNDSPKSANVFNWSSVVWISDWPIEILGQNASRNPPLVLTPSSQTDLSMTQTISGIYNTPIPLVLLYGIEVRIQYQDDVGDLEIDRMYNLPSS